MAERNERIEKLQQRRNVVTDEVFREFCERIRIKDIRYVRPFFIVSASKIPTYNMAQN